MIVTNLQATRLRERIWNEPEFFHTEILGSTPWQKQLEISESIRDHRNTAVRSCNGAGKTYHVAREGLRFLYSFPDSIVIDTATNWSQVENQFWRSLRSAHKHAKVPLGGHLLKTELNIDDTWFAKGIANNPDNVASFQGWHAPHIMVVFDEASGISPVIWEAAVGAMSGGAIVRFVVIGNPNLNSGPFYNAFKDPTFNKIKISAFDIPNVIERRPVVPGLTDHQFVAELASRYGTDSPVYKVRVLGEFPDQAANTLISIDAIEKAIGSDRELQSQDDEYIGLDVARFGDDDTAFIYRRGNYAKVLETYNGNNLMETSGKAVQYLKQFPNARLFIDVAGIGGGVFDRLKEQPAVRERVYGVNSGAQARQPDDFLNVRVESWVNIREWIRDAVLENHESWYQLANPTYKITSAGKMQLESKEEMKKRGVTSPDVADALALTLSRPTEGSNLGVVWI